MRRFLLILPCLFQGACAHSGAFTMEPAAPLEAGPTASVQAPLLFLQPFQDRRYQRELLRSRERYHSVRVKAAGLSRTAEAWQRREYQDMALLWHRSLGQALAASGLNAAAASEPDQAAPTSAAFTVQGRLLQLDFKKQGHDDFVGTAFSGTDYILRVKARVRVDAAGATAPAIDRDWAFKRVFYEPTRMGASDQKSVPGFFDAGLREASADLAGQDDLRALAGLPPYTPTPTPTLTPLVEAPKRGAAATPTPEPTADTGPYWVNPKTGKRVDPKWNFDPEDGTPRKEFILRSKPSPAPTRTRTPSGR